MNSSRPQHLLRLNRLATIAIVFFIACQWWVARSKPSFHRKITVGFVPSAAHAPLIIAANNGLFQQEGLDVQLRTLANAAEGERALLAGELDFLSASPDEMADIFSRAKPPGFLFAATSISPTTNLWIGSEGVTLVDPLLPVQWMKVWFQGLRFLHDKPQDALPFLSTALGLASDQAAKDIKSVRFLDYQESRAYLEETFPKAFNDTRNRLAATRPYATTGNITNYVVPVEYAL